MKKRYFRWLSLLLIVFMVVMYRPIDSKAASYPTVYPKDAQYTVKVRQGNIALITYIIFPEFKNEEIEVKVYHPDGHEVANATQQFYNSDSSMREFTVTWNTANVETGTYTVVAQMRFYSLYRWNEAPRTLTTYVEVSDRNVIGWSENNGKWYYYDKNGRGLTGWQKIENKWYYFDADTGVMQIGWQKLGKTWYYFNTNGVMQTGWQNIEGKWYYFSDTGVMLNGWQQIGKKWYYFSGGVMKTGWLQLDGKWYYFSASGVMKTGWLKIDGKWYYFGGSGVMKTGWMKSGGNWYYFNAAGAMVTGSKKIGSKTYKFDSSGICLNP